MTPSFETVSGLLQRRDEIRDLHGSTNVARLTGIIGHGRQRLSVAASCRGAARGCDHRRVISQAAGISGDKRLAE